MKILLLNQAFYPDTVSTGQHLTDLALDLKSRGHEVTVVAGDHGYDDSAKRFPQRENYQGIQIHRVGYTRLGKGSKFTRAFDFASFILNLFFRLVVLPKQDVVVALTSPPLIAALGAVYCLVRGGKLVYWVMDLNPDEAIAAGWLSKESLTVRCLTFLAGWTFRQSARVIALDRFMKRRIHERYQIPEDKIQVIPPWAHDTHLKAVKHNHNPFRIKRRLNGKFIVMYSGNHSPCHPLDTVLEAALRLKDDPAVLFYFIGGGTLVKKVREFIDAYNLPNVAQFPYEPLDKLSESLSAADLHLVVMGDAFVGILHPCKVYGILAVGRPFVFIGPEESHMHDLILELGGGRHLEHGDAEGLVKEIGNIRSMSASTLENLAERELAFKDRRFGRKALSAEVVKAIERAAL